jgi:hypothetical protein
MAACSHQILGIARVSKELLETLKIKDGGALVLETFISKYYLLKSILNLKDIHGIFMIHSSKQLT